MTDPTSGTVAQIVVRPDSIALDPLQTQQFRAFGRTAAGDSVAATVSWSASAGTITQTGMYTADTSASDVLVTASLATAPISGNGHVKKRQLVQIVVSPASVSLPEGNGQQFYSYGRKNTGDSVSVNVTYTATGGTITSSGFYTAGQAVGNFHVTAKQLGGSLADSSAVAVTAVPVASVAVSPASASVVVGQTVQLAATPKDAGGNPLSGRVVTWATSNAAVATVSGSGLVFGVAAGSATITATSEGQSGTAAVTVTVAVTNPGTVTDLAVVGVADTMVTLSFTEVNDGSGQPASYDVRWAVGAISWGSATSVARGTCGTPVAGTTIGAKRSCTVLGFAPATSYQFQVIAFRGTLNVNAVFGSLSNVVSATTAASMAPVASVTVSPASASVTVGKTVQLVATLKDAGGNVLTGRSVTWASGAPLLATVSGSGLVTGVAVGALTITATSEGQNGTATITVSATGGGTILIQENFDDNAFASRGWYDNTSMVTTTAQHLTGSTAALEAHFLAGATNPTWGGTARHLFTATPTLYVSYWVKYSDNWVGSGQPYHPHEFYVMSDLDGDYDGPSNNWLDLYIEHNYQNGGIPRLALQDNKAINTSYGTPPINLIGITENRSVAGCNGVVEIVVNECYNAPPWYNDIKLDASQPYFLPTVGPGYKGNWNHVEVYFQINSIVGGVGKADGVMQYWFNGTLVIDRRDILFRTGARPSINFHQFLIGPYIGSGSPVDQYMWVDNLTVATAHP